MSSIYTKTKSLIKSLFLKEPAMSPSPSKIVIPAPIVIVPPVIDENYKISEHYTYGMFVHTDRNAFVSKNFVEGKKYVDMMVKVSTEILEPIYLIVGEVTITSGFRCTELNTDVGSGPKSQHLHAEAVDMQFNKSQASRLGLSLKKIFNLIAGSSIKYSQLIYEFDSWIHCGIIDVILHPAIVMQKLQSIKEKQPNGSFKTRYLNVNGKF